MSTYRTITSRRRARKTENAIGAIVISCIALGIMGFMIAGAIYGDCHRIDHKFANRIDCALVR